MGRLHPIVFLVDVDNTLLDNDGVQQDLKDHLERAYGRDARDRYWRSSRICSRSSATATISAPCSAFASNIRAKSSSCRCPPILWTIRSRTGCFHPPSRC